MMKKRNKNFLSRWRESPLFARIGLIGGFASTVLFALYNGGLGIMHSSLWYGSICIYYILLSLLRGVLLATEHKAGRKSQEVAEAYRKKVFSTTAGMVLVMNAALIAPISLMVFDQRPIQTGLIPAIASAAYTTYKVSAAVVKLKRTKETILLRELSMLRLVDALVSILVLQNTMLIAVEGGVSQRMLRLVAATSAGIFLLILIITIVWFVRGLALYRKRN